MKWNSSLYDNKHDFVSKFGESILGYLNPRPNENILDLGCGTGNLTQKISEAEAKVIGIDSSIEMIESAKLKFPEIEFYQMSGTNLNFDFQFDAIFSNAVLHWIPEKEKLIKSMWNALKKDGRIVLEFGGKGNVAGMLKALKGSLVKRGYLDNAKTDFWYFPSIGEYSSLLEKQGFKVVHAEHFDRSTPLKGQHGMKGWFLMFAENFFKGISENEKASILNEIENNLKATHLINGKWFADYKRIRIIAFKE